MIGCAGLRCHTTKVMTKGMQAPVLEADGACCRWGSLLQFVEHVADQIKLFGLGRSKWYFDDGASRMTHPGRGPGAAALKALGDLFFRVLFVVAVLYVVLCLLRWLTGWNISLRP
jgi:hypothetical protein